VPEVNVEINGRKYRMACEEGQQQHLIGLAERFNTHVEALKGAVGEIGDNRLTVMAGIAVVDELAEAERRIKALETEVLVPSSPPSSATPPRRSKASPGRSTKRRRCPRAEPRLRPSCSCHP
jgi:cell division protein ZapA (FtsZ GTPase activity inhibitor)